MSDRTGIAKGSLRPIIYFERNVDNYVILPAYDAGKPEQARMVYEAKYKHEWAWRETGSSLAAVDELQSRLVEQEMKRNQHMAMANDRMREYVFQQTGSALRQQMVSSSTSPWERDFIQAYLKMRNDKRDKYRDALMHHNYYIFARECDDSTKVEDMTPMQEGQFER